MILKAPAKINLGLDVTGRRPDGYHDVAMVMQSLTLHDRVTLEAFSDSQGGWRTGPDEKTGTISIRCNLPFIPTDKSNLAYKAAAALMEAKGVTDHLVIELDKRIPVAAGLAGGSTDAAAVLDGVNRLFGLGCSDEELRKIGAGIGADIPFCLMTGTAKAEGIGDILTPLPPMPACGLLLIKPSFSVSTKAVYQALDASPISEHPAIDPIIEALSEGDLDALAGRLGNVLETVTAAQYPVIGELKEALKAEGALNALMSGSGPTVYGIFRTKEKAHAVREKLRPCFRPMKWIITAPFNKEACYDR